MKYRNFLLIIVLIFTSLPLAAQNYIGMRNHELLDASKMRIENNKLYVISEQSGISLIDLNSNELVSVMEDTDTSSYKNLNFMYFNDLLYTEDMNVFDGNTLELTNKLPFEGTLLGVSDDSYYVRHSPYNVHIINKQNYDSVKVLKLNINLGEFRVAYKNGYILTHGFSNNLTIYNDVEKVGLIPNSPSIYYLSVVDNYVVADMVHKKIVYDFDGNIVYESSINTKSNIYINDDLDYIYIDRINEDENEIVTGNLLSDEEKRVSYVNPIWNNFYYYILGFYDDNYIVYDRVESYLYKFNTDLQQKEYISKFNTFPTNLELLDIEKYNYGVVGSYGYLELSLFNENNSEFKRISYSDQIFYPGNLFFPFQLTNDYLYAPTEYENKNRILKYNITTGEREYIGEFDSLITCLYIDEANNLLYIGDKESKKYIYHLSGNSLLNEFSRNESVFLDIKYLNNNLIVVTQDANGISFVDFVTNEVYAIVEGLNNWEDGTQFNYSENGEIVIYPDGNGGIVVHNLIENKEIANYTLQVEGKITSLAITNNADFIVIGTENDGVYEYTPATDKLVRSKQNRLIPTSNLSGELSYSKVHDIKIDEEKSKYHFIVVDMVFATADYEVVKTSVVDNSEIRTIPLQNGLLNLENYLGSEVISISNISGQEVTYSQVEHHKYRIYNTDKLLFLILRTETEIMTFKLIAE